MLYLRTKNIKTFNWRICKLVYAYFKLFRRYLNNFGPREARIVRGPLRLAPPYKKLHFTSLPKYNTITSNNPPLKPYTASAVAQTTKHIKVKTVKKSGEKKVRSKNDLATVHSKIVLSRSV